jgi:hypothetical protein
MGRRKVIIKQSVADSIASIAWFIESKRLVATAEAFADEVYDYFIKISDTIKSYPLCREPNWARLGYKCFPYKKSIPLFLWKLTGS